MKHLSLLILTALMIMPVVAQEKFKMLGDPMLGSKIRPVEAESYIPFDKAYTELTESQKKIFRAQYGVLKTTEEPPFPKHGMKEIYKPIIEAHAKVARAGTLFLVAMVDTDGKVENVAVYETPSDSITEVATAVLFNTEFDPAVCDGAPCKMEFPFEFNLRKKEKIISN